MVARQWGRVLSLNKVCFWCVAFDAHACSICRACVLQLDLKNNVPLGMQLKTFSYICIHVAMRRGRGLLAVFQLGFDIEK